MVLPRAGGVLCTLNIKIDGEWVAKQDVAYWGVVQSFGRSSENESTTACNVTGPAKLPLTGRWSSGPGGAGYGLLSRRS